MPDLEASKLQNSDSTPLITSYTELIIADRPTRLIIVIVIILGRVRSGHWHSVTFHPTQVNTPRLHPSQTEWCAIYLLGRDRRLSWSRWPVTYRDGLPAHRRSPIEVLTRYSARSGVELATYWSQVRRHNHYTVLCLATLATTSCTYWQRYWVM